MGNNDAAIGLGLAALIGLGFLGGKSLRNKIVPADQAVANPINLSTGAGGRSIKSKDFSSLDPGKILLRKENIDDSITTFKVDPNELTPFDRFLVSRNAFKISESGRLVRQPFKLLPSPERLKFNIGRQIPLKPSPATGAGRGTIRQTGRSIKVTRGGVTSNIPRSAVSTMDNAIIRRTSTPSGQITTRKSNPRSVKKPVTKIIKSGGTTTTLKGTPTQVAVGTAIQKSKSLISRVKGFFKR